MNKNVCQINKSASMELMELAKKLKNEGKDIIDFGSGEPNFDTPMRIKEKMFREVLRGNTHYAIGKGLFILRERITKKLLNDNNIKISPDNIIVTPGAKMAIYLAIRACINNGDEVLIPTPSWVSYSEIVKASGGVPVEVPLKEENNYLLTEDIYRKVFITKNTYDYCLHTE